MRESPCTGHAENANRKSPRSVDLGRSLPLLRYTCGTANLECVYGPIDGRGVASDT